jgi:hypothetical protein
MSHGTMKYTLKAHVCYFALMVGLLHYLYSHLSDFYTSEDIINIYLSMVLTWKRSLTHHSSMCDVLQHDKIISIYSKVPKVCVFTSD